MCGEAPTGHVEQVPAIIVEILSPDTEQLDRQAKFDLYREQGVKYYVIADPEKRALNVFQIDENGNYRQLAQANEIDFDICETCRLTITSPNAFAK